MATPMKHLSPILVNTKRKVFNASEKYPNGAHLKKHITGWTEIFFPFTSIQFNILWPSIECISKTRLRSFMSPPPV